MTPTKQNKKGRSICGVEEGLIQVFFTSQSSKSMMWKTMHSGNLAVKRVRNHWDAYI